MNAPRPLDPHALLAGARLLVMGGTGFLGKVWLSMLLHHFPDVEHVWLVVRPRLRSDGSVKQSSEARFWAEVATSPVFEPLRERYPGAAYESFLKAKITPIPGDVTDPLCGVPAEVRDALRGTLTAFVNASGVVDFNPPLDYALNVNAFGTRNLVALAKDLGVPGGPGLRTLHTSTCYVAGDRTGQVDEVDPLTFPFPKASSLDPRHWDADREIEECVDTVESVRHRANDAFRQTAFLDEARRRLDTRGEPARGRALDDEFNKVKRDFIDKQLVDWGTERAQFWGWHNIYTYTKSIGEQILCRSGVPFTIVRPAVIESAVAFPKSGWNEGINTSAPLIFLAMRGLVKFPKADATVLDVIPVDMVAAGMVLALCELLEGTQRPVYQCGSSDTAPLPINRLIELVGLFKRKHHKAAGGNPLLNWAKAHMEPIGVEVDEYRSAGPTVMAQRVKTAASWVSKLSEGALKPVVDPAVSTLEKLSKDLTVTARITDQFVPFMATHNYRFSCANTRAAHARLDGEDRALLPWCPETIEWRHYILDVHSPGIEANVFPEIDKKLAKEKKPLKQHDDLVALLDEAAERHALAPALLRTHEDGFTRISYRELRARAEAVALRLQAAGVAPGDRVLLSGQNHPDWPICYFGILRAGAVAVPLDPALEADKVKVIVGSARAVAALLDAKARGTFGGALDVPVIDLHAAPAPGATGTLHAHRPTGADLASILYTSGTTGEPKGVMLSHENFCAMVASLGALFPLRDSDRLLSVLPLHHAFEFTCGLLLPLSMGARIIYLDEINGDRLAHGLREGRVTCMVGVPALWQLLERRVRAQVKERGSVFQLAFDGGLDLNRNVGKAAGVDLGRLLFGSVHSRFGGNIRILISGGAALPKETMLLFQGLGLQLSEGYGLTEASPVLTVALPGPGAKAGTVGKAVPGVQLRILSPDDNGVGEVLARGPNVMKGYFGNAEATAAVLDRDGWLHTGDMGKLDRQGRLTLVGRAKEVVVTASGENIYLDDVEAALGPVSYVKEYALVGISDGRGGERLGLLAVPDAEGHPATERAALHDKAKAALTDAIERLPAFQRPAAVHLVDADLPRTATRKVQRKACKDVLEKIAAASAAGGRGRKGEGLAGPVSRAIAAVAGVSADGIEPGTDLRAALGFDSLMFVELAAALEGAGAGRPDADALGKCATVQDVILLVGAAPAAGAGDATADDGGDDITLPESLTAPLRDQLAHVQRWFNGDIMKARVYGRAFIPTNRPTLVVCNHTSHLDMGMVKLALGPYGERMTTLAAKDYFFEGNKYKVAWFRYFTHVQPLDRKAGLRTSIRQAMDVLDEGRVVLIFPEGTRQTSGQLAEFKPLIGKLALDANVDILPLYIDGAYDAMPKGAVLPRKRGVTIRIGPPLEVAELRRVTEGLKPADAARQAANLARSAVEALSRGSVLDLKAMAAAEAAAKAAAKVESAKERAARAAHSLPARFDAARLEKAISWYFSLGGEQGSRFTVSVGPEGCAVRPGKPEGAADCVVKTGEEQFARLVLDAWVPEPTEFFSGAIKTNDIPLLIEFSRVFALSEVSA